MNVYIVEDSGNSPGKIYGVFASSRAAWSYVGMSDLDCTVQAHPVFKRGRDAFDFVNENAPPKPQATA